MLGIYQNSLQGLKWWTWWLQHSAVKMAWQWELEWGVPPSLWGMPTNMGSLNSSNPVHEARQHFCTLRKNVYLPKIADNIEKLVNMTSEVNSQNQSGFDSESGFAHHCFQARVWYSVWTNFPHQVSRFFKIVSCNNMYINSRIESMIGRSCVLYRDKDAIKQAYSIKKVMDIAVRLVSIVRTWCGLT